MNIRLNGSTDILLRYIQAFSASLVQIKRSKIKNVIFLSNWQQMTQYNILKQRPKKNLCRLFSQCFSSQDNFISLHWWNWDCKTQISMDQKSDQIFDIRDLNSYFDCFLNFSSRANKLIVLMKLRLRDQNRGWI